MKDDVEIIDKALADLRDHFEKQGKTFIAAYQLGQDHGDDSKEFYGNVIATTAKDNDYYLAITRWAARVTDYIDRDEEDEKPWLK